MLAVLCMLLPLRGLSQAAGAGKAPPPPPPTLVLVGGTVVDLTSWGHSAEDIRDAVVFIREGRITAIGPRLALPIPRGAHVIDCTGKYLIPGLIDGFAAMNSQGEANANLAMGVTTVVASGDADRGRVDMHASPSPHIYLLDSIGSTDDWSLLIGRPEWQQKLRDVGGHSVELSPQDTERQLADTAKLGTRVLWLGHNLTAAHTQWIIEHAHQMGLVTYGEFVATPYRVGIQADVDVLLHISRYELGAIPDELQKPLVEDPEGPPSKTAYGYAERIPPTDPHLRDYARFLASHRTALMPTFSLVYLQLPDHRNLWLEPAARALDPAVLNHGADLSALSLRSDPKTGELVYPQSAWVHKLPAITQRWMEDSLRKKNDTQAERLWRLNQTIFEAFPHYLAASGAPAFGTLPGISIHTELEMLVRLGLSPREAIAAATSNYAEQFHWSELGLLAPGRRADILVLDGDPTVNIWNARRINTVILDGNPLDRDALMKH